MTEMADYREAWQELTKCMAEAKHKEDQVRNLLGMLSHFYTDELNTEFLRSANPDELYFKVRQDIRSSLEREVALLTAAHERIDEVQRRAWAELQRERAAAPQRD